MDLSKFSNAYVMNENGKEIKISTLWENQNVLFIFLRHFGCIACRGHAQQIWKDRKKYEANGSKIIFIGNGTPEYIKYFKEDLEIQDAPIYTDPTLRAFTAAGFRRDFRGLVNMTTLTNAVKLFSEGHRQTSIAKAAGDRWQLGGVVVMRKDNQLAYHYISQALGDFPPEKDVISL